ncbi:response regulator [Paenibacillus sp. FSL R10-2734]|uniref:response regulator n=1 Tax=Paenibacillus sp. FSL R10-2734 TaxID=2954691 RepID=UPI0030DA7E94
MLKVLIVDDEPWVLEGLRTMIDWEKYGFEVCAEARNGSEAMRLIQEYNPELVLTDINMPVINGLELIAKLNEIMAKPPKFVVLTGYDDFKFAHTALQQRVNDYLLKPIDDEEIESLLSRITPMIRNEIASNEEFDKKQFFIVNNIINRLIQGEYNENLELLTQSTLKLQANAELMCILIEPATSMNPFHRRIVDYFPSECSSFFQDRSGRTGIILQSASIDNESLEVIVNQIRSDIAEQFHEPVLLALSSRMIGVCSIREIYMQAVDVWKRKTHQQKDGVFYYSELRTIKKKDHHKDHFKQLLDKVLANDIEQIQPCVKEAFASFVENQLTIEVVQTRVAHLELTICTRIAQMNGIPDTMMTKLQLEYGNLGELNDYFILSRYVQSLCMLATVYLSELEQQNEQNTIYKVIQYVDREFRNKLKLQDLARQFHINSTYLGQLFRKQTGHGFSEYLNARRIEEAKSLLKRTQLKISDIAVQVGFSNTDYFIDKFKLIVGVVPSVYKNENKHK